jgi:hypothetical protein
MGGHQCLLIFCDRKNPTVWRISAPPVQNIRGTLDRPFRTENPPKNKCKALSVHVDRQDAPDVWYVRFSSQRLD